MPERRVGRESRLDGTARLYSWHASMILLLTKCTGSRLFACSFQSQRLLTAVVICCRTDVGQNANMWGGLNGGRCPTCGKDVSASADQDTSCGTTKLLQRLSTLEKSSGERSDCNVEAVWLALSQVLAMNSVPGRWLAAYASVREKQPRRLAEEGYGTCDASYCTAGHVVSLQHSRSCILGLFSTE
jgi:hypothetical protein